jgi:hypothetical protein
MHCSSRELRRACWPYQSTLDHAARTSALDRLQPVYGPIPCTPDECGCIFTAAFAWPWRKLSHADAAMTNKTSFAAALLACSIAPLPPDALANDRLDAQPSQDDPAARWIIDGCEAHAKAKDQSHAIAVYDDGAHPIALLELDGNPSGATDFAMQASNSRMADQAAAVAHWFAVGCKAGG